MDVSRWLRDLGLENYAQAFCANDIDAEVLSRLTAEDLIALGITSVGHRRKLLDAIAALQHGTAPVSEPVASDIRPAEAERRQLTVLFCDLVGSTELSARLDPEDLRDVIRAYQDACAGLITRYEGHVARYMGDGVLAYFGWPQAHEDDAERAVRTGLELVQRVGEQAAAGRPLAARVGIATGLVVIGDLAGETADKGAVVGETPNLAARLQALAEPGSVVIAEATQRLVGGLFDLADLGDHELRGFDERVRVWRVMGEGGAESRFEALHLAQLTPLVGRDEELHLLLSRWQRARDGEGQVVLLSGEPGIGKSRVVRALRERLVQEVHNSISHYCSPYHTNSALHPVIGLLERSARFDRNDAPAAKLAKLERLLAPSSSDLSEVVPLLAALLAVPVGEGYPLPRLTPQRQKQRTLEVLVEQLEGIARRQPTLAAYEDVHWVDPSTVELLDLVIERAQGLPMLVLITFRPEFSPPWTGHAHVTQLSLSRLTRRHGEALVARVSGGKTLPRDVIDQILARTDGVPLFVEELTKTMLESGLLVDGGDRYVLRGPLPALAIPATLQDSLMARLDRLAPVKEVAQTAAAIGREFSHELLAAVSSLPEKQLSAALDQLVDSGLVFRRGTPPNATYTFKHSLVQDAAYQSLLKSKRLQLHVQIANALEERLPDQVDLQPEVLAHHFSEGGLARQAIGYWVKAGQRAIRHSANTEAITHLSKGLDLVGNLPAGSERAACELDLLIALGPALISAKGQAAPEVEANYAKARALCVEVDDGPRLFAAVRGLYIFYLVRGQLVTAIELGQKLLELAELSRDPGDMVEAHRALCATWMYVGQHGRALSDGRRGLALYDPKAHGAHAYRYGVDSGVALGVYTAWTSWFLGFPRAALEGAEAACTRALASGHPYTLAQALVFACYVHQSRRDPERTMERAESALTVTGEQGFPVWAALMTMLRGWSLTELGDARGGLDELRRGLAAYRSTGAEVAETYLLSLLAEAEGTVGDSEQALATVDEALQLAGTTGVRCWEPELHRLKGQFQLQRERANARAAEDSFRKAIEVAREQEAKSWQLRAATSLARLWAEHGRRARARDLLAPVYGWFTEGFDTADLKEAKALLDELA